VTGTVGSVSAVGELTVYEIFEYGHGVDVCSSITCPTGLNTLTITQAGGASGSIYDFGTSIPTDAGGIALTGASHYYDIKADGEVEACFTLGGSEKLYVFTGGAWVEQATNCWTGTPVGDPFGVGGGGGAATGGRVYSAPTFTSWDLVLFFALAVMVVIAFLAVNPTNSRRKK
jgi:hypothetical protein